MYLTHVAAAPVLWWVVIRCQSRRSIYAPRRLPVITALSQVCFHLPACVEGHDRQHKENRFTERVTGYE